MERACIIHSPGGGSADAEGLEASRKLLEANFRIDVLEVSDDTSPGRLAQRAVVSGARVLIASGGDGTVSAVGGVLAGMSQRRGYRLGILPRGTANSIAAWLGIPSDVEGASAVITRGATRLLDTALVNGRPMLLMAGVGVHGDAITQGTFHLAASAVAEQPAERPNILHFQVREVRIATAEPMRVMVDGEDALQTPVTIRCVPGSLTVFSPDA